MESEAVNNLMLGTSYNLAARSPSFREQAPYLASVIDSKTSIYCCLQTPPRLLQVATNRSATYQITEFLCNYFAEQNHQFPGVLGAANVCEQFAKVWSQKKGIEYARKMNMMVHRLDAVNSIPYAHGALRRAKFEDLDIISDWIFQFAKEISEPKSKGEARADGQRRIDRGELFVWENQGICSMAASSRPTKNGVAINLVYTPKILRGRGYASSCVAALSQRLLLGFNFCSLFTDLNNPTSNYIYRKIGYRPIRQFSSFLFE